MTYSMDLLYSIVYSMSKDNLAMAYSKLLATTTSVTKSNTTCHYKEDGGEMRWRTKVLPSREGVADWGMQR